MFSNQATKKCFRISITPNEIRLHKACEHVMRKIVCVSEWVCVYLKLDMCSIVRRFSSGRQIFFLFLLLLIYVYAITIHQNVFFSCLVPFTMLQYVISSENVHTPILWIWRSRSLWMKWLCGGGDGGGSGEIDCLLFLLLLQIKPQNCFHQNRIVCNLFGFGQQPRIGHGHKHVST